MRIVWAVAGLAFMVVLTSCGANTGKLSDHLELWTTHTVSGPTIQADLVFYNPGSAINLTPAMRRVNGQNIGGCEPGFAIYLTNGKVDNEVGFNEDCSNVAFVIQHGTTHLPFNVYTTFTSCGEPGVNGLII